MGRWRTIVLAGLGVAACGGEPVGLTQAAEVLPNPGGTGRSSEGGAGDDPVVGSTGGGWGGGGREGDGSSSDGPDEDPSEPGVDPGPDGNTVVSGSRLHRRELATPDGASAQTSLWDSELEVPCSFERASDGEQRCMPDLHGLVMFSDPECTQPVIASYWSCDETDYRYARSYLSKSDCDWTIEAYAATEGGELALMPVFSQWTGECAAEGSKQAVPAQRIPDRALVRATSIEHPRADGMSMRMLLADDGAVWPDAIVDEGRGEPCSPDRESGRCIPAAPAWFGERDLLHDASCEQRVVAVDACRGSTLRGRESACDPLSFHEHGDEVDAEGLSQRGEDNVCEPAEDVTGTHVTLGPVIPFETFPVVELVTVGGGTVREQRMVDAAGDSLMAGDGGAALYDESLEEPCWPRLMTDGSIRCLPPALSPTSMQFYADDQCSERVVRGVAGGCNGTTVPPSYTVAFESCGVASSVYALGEELESEEVYWELGGCSLAQPFIGTAPYFRIGEQLSVETFVELDYVVHSP